VWVVLHGNSHRLAALFESSPENIVAKGRLGPGQMVVADLESSSFAENAAVSKAVASRQPYKEWVAKSVRRLEDISPASYAAEPVLDTATLLKLQVGHIWPWPMSGQQQQHSRFSSSHATMQGGVHCRLASHFCLMSRCLWVEVLVCNGGMYDACKVASVAEWRDQQWRAGMVQAAA
jgi:hypothetical protein